MTPAQLEYHGFLMRLALDAKDGRSIPVSELAMRIGLRPNRDFRDVREVRDYIEGDYPVISDARGYRKASCPEEVEEVMATLHKTATMYLRRYSRLRKLKKRRWPNWQPQLFRHREAA